MSNKGRRTFIKSGTIASTLMFSTAAFSEQVSSEVQQKKEKMDISSQRVLGTGKHSLKVNHGMGLGCMGMSWHRTFVPDRETMIQLIRNAYDKGVNFFDTAEAYGPFRNEELVGEAIRPFRKKIILCTKFGFNIVNGQLSGLNSKPSHIREVIEASLRRLKTDYIDLVYQHRVDPAVPIEDVAGTIKDLIKEGKVLNFGLSEADVSNIKRAHAVQQITALQSEYSLISRDPEGAILNTCEELGIGFVPYSPISRALLTGYINPLTKYDPDNDNRDTLPRYTPDAVKANWPLIEAIQEFGNKRGLTAAQVSLAWLMAQKNWIVPIPGTTKLAHLEENLSSGNYFFTDAELASFTAKISAIKITGARN